jgi:hypothetical protein
MLLCSIGGLCLSNVTWHGMNLFELSCTWTFNPLSIRHLSSDDVGRYNV